MSSLLKPDQRRLDNAMSIARLIIKEPVKEAVKEALDEYQRERPESKLKLSGGQSRNMGRWMAIGIGAAAGAYLARRRGRTDKRTRAGHGEMGKSLDIEEPREVDRDIGSEPGGPTGGGPPGE